jgi:hypothetical protein
MKARSVRAVALYVSKASTGRPFSSQALRNSAKLR